MTMDPGLLEPAAVVDQDGGLPIGVRSFAAGGGAIVYTLATADDPCSLRVRDARGDRLVDRLNGWIDEVCDFDADGGGGSIGPDGARVQYWLMPPADMTHDAKHPLAVEVHGGPAWMWGAGRAVDVVRVPIAVQLGIRRGVR